MKRWTMSNMYREGTQCRPPGDYSKWRICNTDYNKVIATNKLQRSLIKEIGDRKPAALFSCIPETDINYLHSIAMDKVAIIPSEYIFDLWRWNVFKGNYKPEDYNKAWWTLL